MSIAEILAQVAAGKITPEAAGKLLPAQSNGTLRCKVADKGGVSVYGLNRQFPVTLYAEQWDRLLAYGDDIRKFIAANEGSLKRKAA